MARHFQQGDVGAHRNGICGVHQKEVKIQSRKIKAILTTMQATTSAFFCDNISMVRRRYTRSMRNTALHLYADNRRAGLLSFQRVDIPAH